jgi:hypothetical protein
MLWTEKLALGALPVFLLIALAAAWRAGESLAQVAFVVPMLTLVGAATVWVIARVVDFINFGPERRRQVRREASLAMIGRPSDQTE